MLATTFKPTDLDRILQVAQLPALPQSAIRLLELSKDANNGPREYAEAIEADPGLVSQVLRFVNSSYFGFSREISNIRHGITLVGVKTIKNFALWNAVFTLLPHPRCGPFDLRTMRQDSLRRALFARLLAKHLRAKDPEDAFSAALLQDMAIPLLAKEIPEAYAELLAGRHEGRTRLSQLEKLALGWTHSQAGGRIARKWNLPEQFATLIELHTQIDEIASAKEPTPEAFAVALSALLPPVGDRTWWEWSAFQRHYHAHEEADVPPPEEILAEVDRQFADLAPTLKLSIPAESLVDWLKAARQNE